jgi:Xaa-Pro aminopeptidase
MNISKDDFLLLTGLAEFHFKFSEYVRENNEEMFFRAIDYAQTFTNVQGIKFDYWHEDNKRFLQELYDIIRKRQTNFDKLASKLGKEEATKVWVSKKKTTNEDPLGMKNYFSNFVRHARELDYDAFDMQDWINFVKIAKNIKNDPKFIEFSIGQIKRVLGEDSELIKEFDDETKN